MSSPSKKVRGSKPGRSPAKARAIPTLDWADDIIESTLAANEDGSSFELSKYVDKNPEKKGVEPPVINTSGDLGGVKPEPKMPTKGVVVVEDPAVVFKRKKMKTGELSSVLTEMFNEWIETSEGERVGNSVPALPLHFFDSSDFSTGKSPTSWMEGMPEEGLDAVVYDQPVGDSLGTFSRILVLGYDEKAAMYEIQYKVTAEMAKKRRVEICMSNEDRPKFMRRLTACLERRCSAEALLRYHYCVSCMPLDRTVISTLDLENSQRILKMALSSVERKNDPAALAQAEGSETVSTLLEEATGQYENVMNKLIFDMNMLNPSNLKVFNELALPPVPPPKPPKQVGVVAMPAGRSDFNGAFNSFVGTTFMTSTEVIRSLLGVVSSCLRTESRRVLSSSHTESTTLTKFAENQNRDIMKTSRIIKDDWPQRTAAGIRQALSGADHAVYNMEEGALAKFKQEDNMLRKLLNRVNLAMSDTLYDVCSSSIKEYSAYILKCAEAVVTVVSAGEIQVERPPSAGVEMPPLLAIGLQKSPEKGCLNQAAVDKANADIEAWNALPDEDKHEPECPIDPVEPKMGYYFEYNVPLAEIEPTLLAPFDTCISELQGVHHVQRYVMERLFWPNPELVGSVTQDEVTVDVTGKKTAWVKELRDAICTAVEDSSSPLTNYVETYKEFVDFLNLDVEEYIGGLKHAATSEDDEPEEGQPHLVKVDVAALEKVLKFHVEQKLKVLDAIPALPVECGMFLIETASIREFLAEKHQDIIDRLLTSHMEHCEILTTFVDTKFQHVQATLAAKPNNVEEVTELKEFVATVANTMAPLEEKIAEMMSYYGALDDFKFKATPEASTAKWTAYGWPNKLNQQCEDALRLIDQCNNAYMQDMLNEQGRFLQDMGFLEKEVDDLERYTDIKHVDEAAERCAETAKKVSDASTKADLFNSREGLFDLEITDYEQLGQIKKNFEPYNNLWKTANDWLTSSRKWLHGSFLELDAEEVEEQVDGFGMAIAKAAKFFERNEEKFGNQFKVAKDIQSQVKAFAPNVPLITALRNKGMRDRHWEQLSTVVGFEIKPDEAFTLSTVLEMKLLDYLEACTKIAEAAQKEFNIEVMLDKMLAEWDDMKLDIFAYAGTGVLKGVDEIIALLDEHVTQTQVMQFSANKGPFEQRIDDWNAKLMTVSEVIDSWLAVQRNWMYLQPIFESPDINKQLPAEGQKFATVDKNWRQTISSTRNNNKVIEFCDNEKLLERFKSSAILLDQVQKGLSDYLETKRGVFARFYFLSDDDLLSILSESKNVKLVQPHFKKCFEAIDSVQFEEDLTITNMFSPEKEMVPFSIPIDPTTSSVEVWMLALEKMMLVSIRDVMITAIADYTVTPRPEWMQKHPAMCVLNGSQMFWTKETEAYLEEHGEAGPQKALDQQIAQLDDMIILVRGKLSKSARSTVGALTVIDVHARDVMKKLVANKVGDKLDFAWSSQLRYYWEEDNLWASMVAARRPYGYEYLGNTFRLVITPLTDKCYLTLMGALQMILGGAPAGPAGTGKTETTKDLAKALAMQCVVFNCSDGLDYKAMGKFFKGLASCGAWACFDEFNRINIEVLSVIGQQVAEIQLAIKGGLERILFEESDIVVNPGFGVFITMNPGYAGRSALPDSLEALFRPVAMMVPDYALIGEIMFIAYGFSLAKECGAKMVTTFRLCSEQCSTQPHYDYGMRAVKTVIVAAGNLKQKEPEADEMILLLRALQDVNIPKFLDFDLPLFEGIISDLFPGKKRPELDYGDLNSVMKLTIQQKGLQPHPWFVTKVIQLYEMIVVRHGLMLVGPTGGGKTSNLKVLQDTLGTLKARGKTGFAYENTLIYQLNPKSITMGQMYGQFDENTREWQDGIMSTMYRHASSSQSSDRKWMMFNGPVDAIWIENMNTVLDDNKKLCLVSGEAIKMSGEMTMMFEVMDLLVASPATVSRVGIIFMEPKALGTDVLIASWLERLPAALPDSCKIELRTCFERYFEPSIGFMRQMLKEQVPTEDNNLMESCQRILDCFFEPLQVAEGRDPATPEAIENFTVGIESLFVFSLIWSVGATTNEDGRAKFNAYLRSLMASFGSAAKFPNKSDVYEYFYNLEKRAWQPWMETVDEYVVDNKLSFSELVVPTSDSVRNSFLLDLLLMQDRHVLMVGETGTGKTVNISQYLGGSTKVNGKAVSPNALPYTINFSAQTSANMTQDMIDAKLDKRKRGTFGPPAGKKFIVHVDDLNMPKREEYGAQPPIEILRQWFDQGGWYDRTGDLGFRAIIDMVFVGSMGPPGGGRQEVTPRFLRHFNVVGLVEVSNAGKASIFGTILSDFVRAFPGPVQQCCELMVESTIEIFDSVAASLLPTPLKSHYTFNLRDLAKVFQGVLMASPKRVETKEQFLRIWVHEAQRVFEDRMVTQEDHAWFKELLSQQLVKHFSSDWAKVIPNDPVVFGDYMDPGADPRIYEEVPDMDKLKEVVEEYLADHNATSKSPMPLVMFMDAIRHVSCISRILRQPGGNALLLGIGGSGRQSMTKLATYIMGYQLFQVKIIKGYGVTEWRDDVRTVLLMAGLKDKPTTFLFNDVQIINEVMLEDINGILNAGDVPNIYGPEEMDKIVTTCRSECTRKRIPPTRQNILNQFIIRVKRNLHTVMCMSPLGETFRSRLLMFPSLVNCCTIDWFTEWPGEALTSVGTSAMVEHDLQLGEHLDNVVGMFKLIHQTVEEESKQFFNILRRHNYVTPTSYLELLSSFKSLLQLKREEINTKRNRLQIGLDKLSTTKDQVAVMQDELTVLMPQVIKKGKEVSEMMVSITADKEAAGKIKVAVEKEEATANEKAAATKEIADSAQRDLDEAIPALQAAVACLDALQKSDIDEIKALKKPPNGVKLTLEVVCIFYEVKPIKDKDPDDPSKKVDNYHKAALNSLLTDAKKFLQMLKDFDKDNIPDRVIKKVTPFMGEDRDDFTPAAIKKASVACEAVCMWARAMFKYHFVALGVAPKKAALAKAQAELDIVMATLAEAQGKLKAVTDRLAVLEANFNAAVEEKAALEAKAEQCKVQLSNASKLIGGLGGEEARWKDTVGHLNEAYTNLIGDVLVSAGTVSYLGPFTAAFRTDIVERFTNSLKSLNLPHTEGVDMQQTLADPVKLLSWQMCALPSDSLSTQNAIMMDKSRRWSLLIDPQGQANRYIKMMGRNKEVQESYGSAGLDLCKMTEKNFLRTLENGIRFGKWVLMENVGEELDASLEPILLQQKFKQGGQDMIKLGDNNVPYSDSFRFFMTTKLPNPHYSPEVQVKITLINFTVTEKGLEEQLLGVVVEQEQPELAERKTELVVQNAESNKQLFDIESLILLKLSTAEGNILDDTALIETLAEAKATSEEIKAKMAEAEVTTKEIFETSEGYRPVAYRASLLYFCLADLSIVDPMYQYALPWFNSLFIRGVQMAPQDSDIEVRCTNLNEYFTFSVYNNVCRSLFEKHKLLFSFLLTIKIMQGAGKIDAQEWRYLISGMSSDSVELENPDPEWITPGVWTSICSMVGVKCFEKFPAEFAKSVAKWKKVFDSLEPQTAGFPEPFDHLSSLQRMCVIRALRKDKVMDAMQNFVIEQSGQKYVEPPPFDLRACYNDSSCMTPLIFVLTSGSDPAKDLLLLAEEMGAAEGMMSIALGQGQGPAAERNIAHGIESGDWVLLQNCHLSVSWMPELERITEEMEEDKTNPEFRLWLTSMPSKAFPVAVLQAGVKMTKEPPKGLKANMRTTFLKMTDEDLQKTNKPVIYRKLLYGLCFFHALSIERKKFGPLGWNVGYGFNETDLDICRAQLELYVDMYDDVPYDIMCMLTSLVNYGGRITDDKDMRTADIIVADMINPAMLAEGHKLSRSGIYCAIEPNGDSPRQSYLDYFDSFPITPEPEVFGMHDNANITCAMNEADSNFTIILSLQPRTGGGGGESQEDVIGRIAKGIQDNLRLAWDLEAVRLQYPTDYNQCLNTTLTQETAKFNTLLDKMHLSLYTIQRALKGLVVLSTELDQMGTQMYNQFVPDLWSKVAYPSLKPLNPWIEDLTGRLNFIGDWIEHNQPPVFWLSGFFFPQGFMTANLQNHARKYGLPIDTVSLSQQMMSEPLEDLTAQPTDGCYVHGLFLEGGRWDRRKRSLVDPRPKELFSPMPVLHLVPEQFRKEPQDGIYRCPVYKILTRTGVLSTTGHSTNFVFWLAVPSNKPTIFRNALCSETNDQVKFCDQDYWIKGGVACFLALRY